MENLWALGPSVLGLPVIVAGADTLISIEPRRHAQALFAALIAKEEARLLVLRSSASPRALLWAFCPSSAPTTAPKGKGFNC